MSKQLREILKTNEKGVALLAFPAPYRSWLTIANDPDHTTIERWNELHAFIWEELNLPLGDALFVVSHNQNLPNQISLKSHPEIANAHHYDTLHFWGDYTHSRKVNFDREEAQANIEILKQHKIQPYVWIDHSSHRGNMMHSSTVGTKPVTKDASGHVYKNFVYTLDLVASTGIRYIWDGDATNFIGQDYRIPRMQWYNDKMSSNKALVYSLADRVLHPLLKKFPMRRFSHGKNDNRQYFRNSFPDGSSFYCFRRYGIWKLADIDGLSTVISIKNINKLIDRTGTCIVYTHLGKRIAHRENDTVHIPESTKNVFRYLREKYDSGELMLSSVSKLLDFLVIRDHIEINGNTLNFKSDDIRFPQLNTRELQLHSFGVKLNNPSSLKVELNGKEIKFALKYIGDNYYNVEISHE